MKIMTSVEIAWVAGIIEGEGCISVTANAYPRITVAMTDLDVLEQLQEFTGMGTITLKSDREQRKTCWSWRVNKHRDVARLLLAIYPLMRERRSAKIEDAIDSIAERLTWRNCINDKCGVRFMATHYSQMFCTRPCKSRFSAKKSNERLGLVGPGTRQRRRDRDDELRRTGAM